ncbi:MAG: glycoside hydrolase family 15 protein, partial [Candidatus Nanopelagicales bacterium]
FWTDWIKKCTYNGPDAEAVRRSLVTLKALTYQPSGGIVASVTTSLPEQIGGPRNWDYRYCWLRDATYTLQALISTGFIKEARSWREWLLRAVAGNQADLQIMYGVDGVRRLPEYELPWLGGYEKSAPVRIGNAAVDQFQLDVWGEVLDGLALCRDAGHEASERAWDVQRVLLDFLEGHWQEPDNSLWEVRGEQRQFVHSKVMAWVGFDRAVHAVENFGLSGDAARWKQYREQVRQDILRNGFNADRGTFVQAYGSDAVDAALLLIPRVGFLPWDDPRVKGTVRAVQEDLCQDGFVLRYRPQEDAVDGLPGDEGAFIACSFWLADALCGIGRIDEARELFDSLLGLRNDLGLLSEQYDVGRGRLVGNFPQAFSHVALVNSTVYLSGHIDELQTRR